MKHIKMDNLKLLANFEDGKMNGLSLFTTRLHRDHQESFGIERQNMNVSEDIS